MAKLNSPAMELAAAVSAATLTTSRKLSRNFTYYRSNNLSKTSFSRDSLLNICDTLRMDLFGLQNLFLDYSENPTPFMVTIAGNIFDSFENLHRKLLFYDADKIETLIPKIDLERAYWSGFTSHLFYEEGIPEHIDSSTLPVIFYIKEELNTFPNRPEANI